jgi:formylglycine-generating enzyme required for sulfatase activity
MGGNPSHFAQCGDDCPVEKVSWDDVQAYISKLNQKTGKTYRLPSEAEWEYACRAGAKHEYCGSDSIDSVAWYGNNLQLGGNSGGKTHPVAGRQANDWGLNDMTGNVWEWTQDCWNDTFSGAPSDGSAWTTGGCAAGRVLRGASWRNGPQFASLDERDKNVMTFRSHVFGFRLARTIP